MIQIGGVNCIDIQVPNRQVAFRSIGILAQEMSKPLFEDLLTFHKGRRNRKSYLLINAVYAILMLPLFIFEKAIDKAASNGNMGDISGQTFIILAMLYFVLVVLYFAVMTQRCRDLDWSGWWVLISFIPIVHLIFSLLLFFKRGTTGENRYGQDWLESRDFQIDPILD